MPSANKKNTSRISQSSLDGWLNASSSTHIFPNAGKARCGRLTCIPCTLLQRHGAIIVPLTLRLSWERSLHTPRAACEACLRHRYFSSCRLCKQHRALCMPIHVYIFTSVCTAHSTANGCTEMSLDPPSRCLTTCICYDLSWHVRPGKAWHGMAHVHARISHRMSFFHLIYVPRAAELHSISFALRREWSVVHATYCPAGCELRAANCKLPTSGVVLRVPNLGLRLRRRRRLPSPAATAI